mgnify:CR=1 FL=1
MSIRGCNEANLPVFSTFISMSSSSIPSFNSFFKLKDYITLEHIESMIASQPDPDHWSLYGYKTLAEGWRQLEELGTWELRDTAIENGEV